jgi:hypothetical protein
VVDGGGDDDGALTFVRATCTAATHSLEAWAPKVPLYLPGRAIKGRQPIANRRGRFDLTCASERARICFNLTSSIPLTNPRNLNLT